MSNDRDLIRRFSDRLSDDHIRGEMTAQDWQTVRLWYRRDPAYLAYLAKVHGTPHSSERKDATAA